MEGRPGIEAIPTSKSRAHESVGRTCGIDMRWREMPIYQGEELMTSMEMIVIAMVERLIATPGFIHEDELQQRLSLIGGSELVEEALVELIDSGSVEWLEDERMWLWVSDVDPNNIGLGLHPLMGAAWNV